MYIAYGIIIGITLIPEALVIVIEEANFNLLDRNDSYSNPPYYFSIFEFIMENLGYYQNDIRLTNFILNAIHILIHIIDYHMVNDLL